MLRYNSMALPVYPAELLQLPNCSEITCSLGVERWPLGLSSPKGTPLTHIMHLSRPLSKQLSCEGLPGKNTMMLSTGHFYCYTEYIYMYTDMYVLVPGCQNPSVALCSEQNNSPVTNLHCFFSILF